MEQKQVKTQDATSPHMSDLNFSLEGQMCDESLLPPEQKMLLHLPGWAAT